MPRRKNRNRPFAALKKKLPELEPPDVGFFAATVCGRGTIARGFGVTPQAAAIRAGRLAESSRRIGDRPLDPSE
jgi:hypothetical protein